MMKRFFLAVVTGWLFSISISAQPHDRNEKDFALFFAVDDYDYWSDIHNSISTAETIAKDLREQYSFQTEVLKNPTQEDIINTLSKYVEKSFLSNSQLFIYFSGHGEYIDNTAEGFFIPRDGKKKDLIQNTYVPHARLERIISQIPCEHILLAIDACYSGTFDDQIALSKKKGNGDKKWKRSKETIEKQKQLWIESLLKYKSRLYLASGGKEQTSTGVKFSPFSEKLINAFRSLGGEDRVLTYTEILPFLETAKPAPKSGQFEGDEGGSFVFVWNPKIEKNIQIVAEEKEEQFWKKAKETNTLVAYQNYIAQYEQGIFKYEAIQQIKALLDEKDWINALNDNNEETYKHYLEQHPYGKYVNEANEKLNILLRLTNDGPCAKKGGDKDGDGFCANEDCNDNDRDGQASVDYDGDGICNDKDLCDDKPGPISNHGCPIKETIADKMVFVKGGTFMMGCIEESYEDCKNNKETAHQVSVDDFYISKSEVTQEEWELIMGNNPSHFQYCKECPVENVSWEDVQIYIENLNKKTGLNYRLPTEAEWEFAARGGNQSKGYIYSGGNDYDKVSWHAMNSEWSTHPIKEKEFNELGLFDMSGNVAEWCVDWYGKEYYMTSPINNPKGAKFGSNKVIRGGDWGWEPKPHEVTYRQYKKPIEKDNSIGFRLCRSVQ